MFKINDKINFYHQDRMTKILPKREKREEEAQDREVPTCNLLLQLSYLQKNVERITFSEVQNTIINIKKAFLKILFLKDLKETKTSLKLKAKYLPMLQIQLTKIL